MITFQKSQHVAVIKKRRMEKELKNPNSGMMREEAPVHKSQTDTIRLICSVEKILVMEGSPALS